MLSGILHLLGGENTLQGKFGGCCSQNKRCEQKEIVKENNSTTQVVGGSDQIIKKNQTKVQPKLFTPGPLSTTERVKQTMNFDYGSRSPEFVKLVADIRQSLLDICNVKKGEYESILLQGSGTFGVEATIGCMIPRNTPSKVLICCNGAYGDRMATICEILGIEAVKLSFLDNQVVNPDEVKLKLEKTPGITHLAVVHSETTSGNKFK